ncbi:MAG: mannose-1-phosphate guanylyltransferase/mannose-6-phosphate isomerase, partial [Chloroflexota bacterium]|nr:mannose-1-phosphate guanylyltransferase/mannose-6-phosphate isomerase [Chloroflexota bacterium]
MTIYPVILAGGSGTRLWPLSREYYPKQFLPLISESSSMLQETLARLELIEEETSPILVCSELHRFIIADQLREVGVEATSIIVEPAGRNTAPALTLGALRAQDTVEDGSDPILLVTHSDHLITEPRRFLDAFRAGLALASEGDVVTFGVPPTGPETGYGYIEKGNAVAPVDGEAYTIQSFVEKPDLPTATEYCESGRYLWNSGIFMMRASVWLRQLEQHRPDIAAAVREAYSQGEDFFEFFRPDEGAFLNCPSESIDYAVMEGAGSAAEENDGSTGFAVVPIDVGWSDIGSWSTLWEQREQDVHGNVVQGDVYTDSTKNSLVIGRHRLVAAIGLEDLVVIETADAVLVAHKDRVQDIKGIVEQLRKDGRPEADVHRKVHRPWGSFDILDAGEGFQVKRLTISPGASVSFQYHNHRAEHWIVVRGTARVTKGAEVFLLKENESVSIPQGMKHRLENPGTIPLEVIEAQMGDYLGEDDIIRLEDNYNRETSTEE